jgi:hypothetical protein
MDLEVLAMRLDPLDDTPDTRVRTVQAGCIEARRRTTREGCSQSCGSAVNRVAFRHGAQTTQWANPARAIPTAVTAIPGTKGRRAKGR